jgi:hypothetical protein
MAKGFVTAAEAAAKSGTTDRRIQQLCVQGKVPGAQRFGKSWMIPAGFKWKAQKPGPKPKPKEIGR